MTKTVEFLPHNSAMPDMSSAGGTTDAARRLSNALANPAPAAPFACFGTQIMYAIWKLAKIFATTRAPPRNPTPSTRYTCATVQIPRRQHNTNPQAPPRVPPAVPPNSPPRPPPDPPQMVDPPACNPPHSYPLRPRTQANHTVETVGAGAISFQGVLDPVTGKTKGYTQLIRGPDKGTWTTALSNDIGRLAQGVGKSVKGTNTIFFIHHSEVPAGKRVTYG